MTESFFNEVQRSELSPIPAPSTAASANGSLRPIRVQQGHMDTQPPARMRLDPRHVFFNADFAIEIGDTSPSNRTEAWIETDAPAAAKSPKPPETEVHNEEQLLSRKFSTLCNRT